MGKPKMFDFAKIEKKWQRRWEKEKAFVSKDKGKDKYYVLEMYPYPSGSGLHMGHAFNYTIGDIHARLKRMQGFNVLYPMGYDSFGLPAENAAIEAKSHPKRFTEDAIKNYVKQQKALGLSYDWSRKIASHEPDFYKWDQWIFLKMFEKGLAYKKKASVNWCPKCNTVLANEQVVNGRCWRHEETVVEIRQMEQWFLRITDYADSLLQSLDELPGWPEAIKRLQRNWIGKSQGTQVDFEVLTALGEKQKWPVFTTRPDTLFGVTFLVVSAQHEKLWDLVTEENKKDVEALLKKIISTKQEDSEVLEKEGVFTGSYALHPLTGQRIPIWAGNFVLPDYGSGMVMAVPAHDQRDFDFAKKHKLPIKEVVRPHDPKALEKGHAYTGYGVLVDSEGFTGLGSMEAMKHITNALEMKHKGRDAEEFKIRDWLISRQRFWGCPIPIIYCDSCGPVAVPEKDLPVKLPEKIRFTNERNPLKDNKSFVDVKCPKCKGKGKRETDTMDTFVDSAWYFLRYTDPKNNKEVFDKKKANHWMPIDQYIGGKEHAVTHLIYSRFFMKFLNELGLVNFDEPFLRLFNQGFLFGPNGQRMSKSKGNVVLPETVSKKFGMDAARMFLVSVASPDKDINWSDKGAEGSLRFVMRVMHFVSEFRKKERKMTRLRESRLNSIVREYTKYLEDFAYNLAVIELRELFSVLEEGCDKKSFEVFLKLLSPICPHIAEELWHKLGHKSLISLEKWPEADEKKIDMALEKQAQAVEKTIDDINNILRMLKEKKAKADTVYLYVLPQEKGLYEEGKLQERVGKEVKVFAVNDKSRHDPQNKSAKVKPGRPGIYVE